MSVREPWCDAQFLDVQTLNEIREIADARIAHPPTARVGGLIRKLLAAYENGCEAVEQLEARSDAAREQADALREAIRQHLAIEPPPTASPYWTKPEGDLRAAFAAAEPAAADEEALR